LYSDGQEKIRALGDRIKRIHTDGFIDQLIGRYEDERSELKIVKSGIVSIKNVMNLKWVNFEEIIPPSSAKTEKSPIRNPKL
jgi:hypothetical protein